MHKNCQISPANRYRSTETQSNRICYRINKLWFIVPFEIDIVGAGYDPPLRIYCPTSCNLKNSPKFAYSP